MLASFYSSKMAKEIPENPLSKSKQELGKKDPPTPEVLEPFLEKFDQKIEKRPKKREIIEKAEAERFDFLEDILKSRLADVAGNLIPGIDLVKMTNEAIEGKTSSGIELRTRDRMAYLLMVAGIAVFYLSFWADRVGSMGVPDVCLGSRLGVAVIGAIEGLSLNQEMIAEQFQKAGARFPKVKELFSGIGGFLKNDETMFDDVDYVGVKEVFLNNLRQTVAHE